MEKWERDNITTKNKKERKFKTILATIQRSITAKEQKSRGENTFRLLEEEKEEEEEEDQDEEEKEEGNDKEVVVVDDGVDDDNEEWDRNTFQKKKREK